MPEDRARKDVNRNSPGVTAVLRPLNVIINNYPECKADDIPEDEDLKSNLNPDSLEVLTDWKIEPVPGLWGTANSSG